MPATPTPWPDLPELERRLKATEEQLARRLARGLDPADRVTRNLMAREDSYRRDIALMKQHRLDHLGSRLWECHCGFKGRASTKPQARLAWGRHVEKIVWGEPE